MSYHSLPPFSGHQDAVHPSRTPIFGSTTPVSPLSEAEGAQLGSQRPWEQQVPNRLYNRAIDPPQPTTSTSGGLFINSSSSPTATAATQPTDTIASPWTLEGQRIGAILQVYRVPERKIKIRKGAEFNMILEVGDCVRVQSTKISSIKGHDTMEYVVENLRTGAVVSVPWNTFLPVGTRESCVCDGVGCRCFYVDFDRSVKFLRQFEGRPGGR